MYKSSLITVHLDGGLEKSSNSYNFENGYLEFWAQVRVLQVQRFSSILVLNTVSQNSLWIFVTEINLGSC